jgi:hypothetical protein
MRTCVPVSGSWVFGVVVLSLPGSKANTKLLFMQLALKAFSQFEKLLYCNPDNQPETFKQLKTSQYSYPNRAILCP